VIRDWVNKIHDRHVSIVSVLGVLYTLSAPHNCNKTKMKALYKSRSRRTFAADQALLDIMQIAFICSQ